MSQEKRDTYFIQILEELQGEIIKLNENSTALPEPKKEDVQEPTPVVQEQKKVSLLECLINRYYVH